MRRRIPMSKSERNKELAVALRYVADARAEYNGRQNKTDLIGRALADQLHRMVTIYRLVKDEGIPFGVGRNK